MSSKPVFASPFEALGSLLRRPETGAFDIDDPRTTDLRREIIRRNGFLKRIYEEWYGLLSSQIPDGSGKIVELGSGGGFLEDFVPEAITSEVFWRRGVRAVLDGRQLPFATSSLRSIVMVDVLHHIPESRPFLAEAERCLAPGGAILMIEPWVTKWSSLVYRHLHHEPFHPESRTWSFPAHGPLSGANGALPWIVFERDGTVFEKEFPNLKIREVRPMTPLRYLVSGGVSMRQLMPEATFRFWTALDSWLSRWPDRWPMFAMIDIRRS
jgi:SAM-dependent methyltransferase